MQIYSVITKELTHKNEAYLDLVPNADCEILEQAITQAMDAIHAARRDIRSGTVVLSLIETDLDTGMVKQIHNRRELEDIYDSREEREQYADIASDHAWKQRLFLEAAE